MRMNIIAMQEIDLTGFIKFSYINSARDGFVPFDFIFMINSIVSSEAIINTG